MSPGHVLLCPMAEGTQLCLYLLEVHQLRAAGCLFLVTAYAQDVWKWDVSVNFQSQEYSPFIAETGMCQNFLGPDRPQQGKCCYPLADLRIHISELRSSYSHWNISGLTVYTLWICISFCNAPLLCSHICVSNKVTGQYSLQQQHQLGLTERVTILTNCYAWREQIQHFKN